MSAKKPKLKLFRVRVREVVVYELTVRALTDEHAKHLAVGRVIETARRDKWVTAVEERDAIFAVEAGPR